MIRHLKEKNPQRWRKALAVLLASALLAAEQGSSFYAAAADVVEGAKVSAQVNLGGTGNLGKQPAAPQLLPSGNQDLGVNVEIPAVGDSVRVEPAAAGAANPNARVETILPAQAGGQPVVVSPQSIPIAAPAATPATVVSPENGAPVADKMVEAQTGGLSRELSQPAKSSGSFFTLFTRFFDRRSKSSVPGAWGAASHQAVEVSAPRREEASAQPLAAAPGQSRTKEAPAVSRRFIEFNAQYLKDIKSIFAASKTKPNRQDYVYLLTKTFGINLIIRTAFAVKGVHDGQLGLVRAVASTSWYQLQDALFTVFGQTYMKFLGKMSGMLRIGRAKLGDLLFVYVQLVASEFVNRLVLGPLGENPLVYSAHGIGLLLLNNLQGMISGGLLVPVINKMRDAGVISEKTSNNLYQLASLTMHLGLLATFGYQHVFTILTTAIMILSWSLYIGFSFFYKGKPVQEHKL
ncbi:MAG: hypothetical protein HY077_07145 [Elusimicrobia bacterium]|nr:hypothetical protein [Elusimicrobiota bacterium]